LESESEKAALWLPKIWEKGKNVPQNLPFAPKFAEKGNLFGLSPQHPIEMGKGPN